VCAHLEKILLAVITSGGLECLCKSENPGEKSRYNLQYSSAMNPDLGLDFSMGFVDPDPNPDYTIMLDPD
jgi:hypothetical protein